MRLLKAAYRFIPGKKHIKRKFEKVDSAYEKGKEFIDKHESKIQAAKWIARTIGGEKGKKLADDVDKVQGVYKKVTGKIDKVRDTAKSIIK